MQRPSHLFSESDRQQVEQAVAAAESQTSAEIVAAVAGASGRYDRPEDIIGLWTGLVAMGVTWALWSIEIPEQGSWGETSPLAQLAALVLAVVLGFILGAVVGSHVGWLRRLFTPRVQMHEEVWARARQVFFDRRVSRTAGRSGLLIYVSLFERMAAVVADDAVFEKLGPAALDELCSQLTAQLRRGNPTAAFCSTIAAAGKRLSPVLPRATDDVNELGDALVLLD
jgi:putative membrane protein